MSAGRWDPSPPKGRHDFEIAIMCALPIEADAVAAMFDRRWDSSPYGTVAGDTNTYSTGAIGRHNVVLVHLPNMGKVAAATAATFLRASYGCINLALVVGICGGVPFGNSPNTDIFLGDVVISDGVIQYDLGRRFPHGFVRKDHIQDNLPRPSLPVRTFLAKLQANETSRLREKTLDHLYNLQQKQGNAAKYLRPTEDWLFKPTYRHKHSNVSSCPTCSGGIDSVCSAALKFSCQELGCDEHELVLRTPSKAPSDVPTIHFGLVASGDLVMKSGEDRDRVASHDGAIAFEMEGAGAWEALPGCLIIKGVCDYADSHKNKIWQAYAAATAAATSKAALENWDTLTGDTSRPHFSHRPTPLDPWVIDTAPVEGSRRVAILKKLFTSPYRDRKERNPDRVAGTCEWFVAHERFQEWRKSPSSGMLFVSADPGCGKSVLAKYLVDSELSTIDSRTTCYFFFKDDFEDQRSARSALCCILHQLFEQNGALLSSRIAERFETGGEHLTSSFVELWEILITVSQNKNAGEIICILDAFDECEDQGQVQFVRYLKQLYGTQKHSDSNLKFLLTSRPYGHIKRGFQPLEIPDVPVIFLSGENEIEMSKIAKEIDIYIKARVRCIQESHKLESFEEDLLLQQLLRIPNRTYLWAHLTLDLVEKDIDSDIDKTRIKKVTSQLPRTVDEAYERILAKSLNIDDAQKLLHIVIAAARPLTLSEMNIALTIRETHQSYRDLDIMYERRFRRYVRDLCGLFVAIIDSKIYLLHQTAKEFLVQVGPGRRQESINVHFRWKCSLSMQDSHSILSAICIWYLLFAEFDINPLYGNESISEYLRGHSFLEYSAKNWAGHFRMSRINNKAVIASAVQICDANSRRCLTWFGIYWNHTHGDFPLKFTGLMIASYFGLGQLVKIFLSVNRAELSLRDGTHKRSALSWASENGFDDVVKLLLEAHWIYFRFVTEVSSAQRAILEEKDRHGRTPLSHAAFKGHVAVVERLVKLGARVDSRDDIGGTPLSYAILCNGEEAAISSLMVKKDQVEDARRALQPLLLSAVKRSDKSTVKLLIESGKVDPDNSDPEYEDGRTPLSLAAGAGSEYIVKQLLECGKAHPDSKDNSGRTPLSWASENGFEGVVRLLLESGRVDHNSKDTVYGQTPLSWASGNGSEATVKLLLRDNRADPKSRDNFGRTPLSWAAGAGFEAVVKLLLEDNRVDPDSKDHSGRTPLLWATGEGFETVVKLLLEDNRVDPNSKDNSGRTPLSWAIGKGFETIIRLLLEDNRVDPNLKDGSGQTPLSWASGEGSETVVKLLLGDNRVDPNLKNDSDWTPLFSASINGHEAVVKFLLESSKANPDLKDSFGRTPLFSASTNGHEAVVKLLLESGKANPDLKDSSGRTPLFSASTNSHEAVVKLLLESGKVNPDLKDSFGRTPLFSASTNGREAVVKLLLNNGKANPDLEDNSGQTPIFSASTNGREAVVKLLLKSGKANPDWKDKSGQTPLFWASTNGHKAVVKLLLESGKVNPDLVDSSGQTPLFWASMNGREAVVKLLLESGKVNSDLRDSYGRTPLDWADENRHRAVFDLLNEWKPGGSFKR